MGTDRLVESHCWNQEDFTKRTCVDHAALAKRGQQDCCQMNTKTKTNKQAATLS